jgi:hypothetical protein
VELWAATPVRHDPAIDAGLGHMTDFLKLHEDLATADRHIAESKARVDRQADVAAELDKDGHDTTEAQDLLRVLQESLDAVKSHREYLLHEWLHASAADRPR